MGRHTRERYSQQAAAAHAARQIAEQGHEDRQLLHALVRGPCDEALRASQLDRVESYLARRDELTAREVMYLISLRHLLIANPFGRQDETLTPRQLQVLDEYPKRFNMRASNPKYALTPEQLAASRAVRIEDVEREDEQRWARFRAQREDRRPDFMRDRSKLPLKPPGK